jgi:hypothetical protein
VSTRKKRGKNAKAQPRGKPFAKGNQAAKGHGRPPLPEDYKAAIAVLEVRALEVLEEVLDDVKHPRREQAAEYVIDRNRGRTKQTTELSGLDGAPIAVRAVRTSDERRERMRELAEKAARIAAEASGSTTGDDHADGDDDDPDRSD